MVRDNPNPLFPLFVSAVADGVGIRVVVYWSGTILLLLYSCIYVHKGDPRMLIGIILILTRDVVAHDHDGFTVEICILYEYSLTPSSPGSRESIEKGYRV